MFFEAGINNQNFKLGPIALKFCMKFYCFIRINFSDNLHFTLQFVYFTEVSDGHSGQLHPIIVKLL